MATPATAQPHDLLFRWAFSQHEHVIGLLKAVLPPAISAAASFQTLRLEQGSFVNQALRSRHSDLLLGRSGGAAVAFVHADRASEHGAGADGLSRRPVRRAHLGAAR